MINTSQAVQALVFAPTEQAADLVHQTLEKKMKGNSGACCYLCNPSKAVGEAELGNLIEGSRYHIVVGIPEHLLGLILRNILKTHHVKILALDDIDKLLEIGSEGQIFEIYRHTPPLAQVIVSCTVPPSATPAAFFSTPARPGSNSGQP
ncbi:hypothetical protein OPQ81_004955 [Rhizoctonia solani]|nr:hypothetical protein OPQ81_004955 [Rhizoctonia solani]